MTVECILQADMGSGRKIGDDRFIHHDLNEHSILPSFMVDEMRD